MAGTHVPILRRTDGMGFAGAQNVVIGPQLVDATGWVSGVLLVRLYPTITIPAGGLVIGVQNVMVSPEDEVNVVEAKSGANPAYIASLALPTAATAGLYVAAFTPPISKYVRVLIAPTAGTTTVTLGIDLIGRSA